MEIVESTGKNIQDAIDNGLNELGTTIDNVKVEIISEGGMFKKAKVRLQKIMKTEIINEVMDEKTETIESVDETETSEEVKDNQTNETIEETQTTLPQMTYSLNILNDILKMYKNGVIATQRIQNKVIVFDIQGEGCEVFGNTEAVNALQTLLNNIERIHNKGCDKRIIINVGDYEKKRDERLKNEAIKCADQAISSGKTIRMQPMNSFERHLVHDFLADRKDVIAESFGVEPYRYITIRPSDEEN